MEKPSVLSLSELDELVELAKSKNLLAKVVYHKLLDPDHKKLRTFVADGVLKHVNNGYCTLLEPKQISGSQFAEWITGRNPGTYVAVHYIKLIDFTFGGKLKTITATGQRGLVGPADGPTWDSCQMRMIYEYDTGREAAFDIHTSWVTPDNFPGYVEQEVQFRFDNGLWNGHSRKRGVECTVEGQTPFEIKNSINNHYNAPLLEPWGQRSQRGYGVEVIERFAREVAEVEFGGPDSERSQRLKKVQSLNYNDLAADRQVVAAVQALEAILDQHANGNPDCVVRVNDRQRRARVISARLRGTSGALRRPGLMSWREFDKKASSICDGLTCIILGVGMASGLIKGVALDLSAYLAAGLTCAGGLAFLRSVKVPPDRVQSTEHWAIWFLLGGTAIIMTKLCS